MTELKQKLIKLQLTDNYLLWHYTNMKLLEFPQVLPTMQLTLGK